MITVCDETSAEQCPFFPGITTRLHWSFADPSGFTGTQQEKLEKTRQVREAIREKIEAWLKEILIDIPPGITKTVTDFLEVFLFGHEVHLP